MNRHMATQMNRQMEIQTDQMDSQLDRQICGLTGGGKDARSTQYSLFYRRVIDEEKKFSNLATRKEWERYLQPGANLNQVIALLVNITSIKLVSFTILHPAYLCKPHGIGAKGGSAIYPRKVRHLGMQLLAR